MRKTPILSFMIFALTAVIFLAQVFPATGGWMTIIGGPYWSVVTINIAFLVMAAEAMFGACPKKYMAFPAVYFGGYFAIAGFSHAQYYWTQKKTVEHNASVRVPFDPAKDDLVVAPGLSVAPFLTVYGLQEAYLTDSKDKDSETFVSFVGGRKVCNAPQKFGLDGAAISNIREHEFEKKNNLVKQLGTVIKDICLVKMKKKPDGKVVTVKLMEADAGSWYLPMKKREIEIVSSDGTRAVIKGGSAAPLNILPAFYMGCGPKVKDGSSSWRCSAGFLRQGFQSLNKAGHGSLGDFGAVARALQLKYAPIDKKYKPAEVEEFVERITAERVAELRAEALGRFDALMDDPVNFEGSMDFYVLMDEQEFFIKHSVIMIKALTKIEENFMKDGALAHHIVEKREFLSDALAMLPVEVLEWQKPLLLKLYSPAKEKQWTWQDTWQLAIRTGDLGAEFYPLYKELLEMDSPFFPRSVVYATCRAGTPVRSFVGKALVSKLEELSMKPGNDSQKRAVYIALARMGLKGEAEKIIPFMKLEFRRDGDEKVSYKEPSSVCVNADGLPVFPDD